MTLVDQNGSLCLLQHIATRRPVVAIARAKGPVAQRITAQTSAASCGKPLFEFLDPRFQLREPCFQIAAR